MNRATPWLLAAASGLVLALGLPGPGWTPLVILFPGLLLEAIGRSSGRAMPWILGWFAGCVHWVVATNWVVPVMHHYGGLPRILAVGCLIGMGAILGTLWAAASGITSLVPPGQRVWILPFAWIACQVLRRFPPFEFTWNGVASAFVDWPWLMASVPVWGATGLGCCVVAVGSALWAFLRPGTRREGVIVALVAGGLLVFAVIIAPSPSPVGSAVTFAAIQPGTSLKEKWDPTQSRDIARRVWTMTEEAALKGAEIVLWPEGAVPYRVDNDPAYRAALEGLAAEREVEIVLNSIASTSDGGYANSAYLVTGSGLSPVRYDKIHLVPFGEFVPRWARFAFTESLVREVGAFTPGESVVLLPARAPLGVAICFEVVFPDLVAAQARAGAEVLTTLTNDGWYGFSWAPRQHFVQVRLRAAEAGRWYARAALTGISGFVDPSGRVHSMLDVGETGIVIAEIQPLSGLTPRARWGDWWAVLCVIVTFAGVVGARVPRRPWPRKRVKSEE
jgi:apolipoprotein N-acyltransferase